MTHDFRDALRRLKRAPAFTIVAVMTLALAIGSATTVFSVIDAVILRGLPYSSPTRLQTIYESADNGNLRVASYPTFKDWQARGSTVRDVIDGFAYVRGDGVLVPSDEPGGDRQIDAYVTPGFFDITGVRPLIGREFRPDEELPSAPPVAVISYAYFLKRFAGDPSTIGKTIALDSVPTTIVGVMPRGFAYPNFGGNGWVPPAFWQPITVFERTHAALGLRGLHVDSRVLIRLAPGADSARAAVAMRTIAKGLALEYPAEQAHWTSVAMRGLSDELFGGIWSTILLIGAAVGLVVLLACANVANLMLVRASIRERELAVRAALGAAAWQLARSLLAEALIVATAAAAIGVATAVALLAVLRPFADQRLPFATDIRIDGRAALFTTGVAALTALLIGVLPAIQANRGSLVARLRGGSAAGGGVAERRLRHALVSVQFALAMTVLIGAGLLIQSVRRIGAVPLGYEPGGVVSFAIAPPAGRYDSPEQAAALYQRILESIRAVPTVRASAATGGALLQTKVETGETSAAGAPVTAAYHPISTDFLKIMRVPVVEGRGFSDDDMRSPNGFLITKNLAEKLWPGASAIGKRITVYRSSQARKDFGQPITMPVVGVVANYRAFGPDQPEPTQVFLPFTLEVWPWMNFSVRSSHPSSILNSLTTAIKSVEPAVNFYGKPSVDNGGQSLSMADPRVFVTMLMGGFALMALLVAAIGLYGIVAYGVAQRTREIGIRIAIGATSKRVVTLVLRHALGLVIGGVAVGMLAAASVTGLIKSMLFQTTTTDLATFIVVPIVLSIVAVVASLIPAYRAARTDPIIAIRAD